MKALQKSIKVYVPVEVAFNEDGQMFPRIIHWEDGHKYEIEKMTDVRSAPAAKAGGQGDRYEIRINGKVTYIFFEHSTEYGSPILGRWFVERNGG